jgi:hypothetical protein
VDITTANSGDATNYPEPPKGIKIRRLTHSRTVSGIVRGSANGKLIVFLANDKKGINQVFVIPADGSELSPDAQKQSRQVSHFKSHASFVRWHPFNDWLFAVVNGNIAALFAGEGINFGTSVMLTNDNQARTELVVSNDGNTLACNIRKTNGTGEKTFSQIFVLDPDWEKLNSVLKNQIKITDIR